MVRNTGMGNPFSPMQISAAPAVNMVVFRRDVSPGRASPPLQVPYFVRAVRPVILFEETCNILRSTPKPKPRKIERAERAAPPPEPPPEPEIIIKIIEVPIDKVIHHLFVDLDSNPFVLSKDSDNIWDPQFHIKEVTVPVEVIKIKEVIQVKIKEVPVDKIIEVTKEVPGPIKYVDKIIEVTKEVPGPIKYVDKIIEVTKEIPGPIQYVEKRVEVPIEVPVEVPVDKIVFKEVVVEKILPAPPPQIVIKEVVREVEKVRFRVLTDHKHADSTSMMREQILPAPPPDKQIIVKEIIREIAKFSVNREATRIPSPVPPPSREVTSLGMKLSRKNGARCLTVEEIFPGFAVDACKQIAVGDEILSLNGQDLTGLGFPRLRDISVGPEGSECTARVRRGALIFDVTLTRIVPRPGR